MRNRLQSSTPRDTPVRAPPVHSASKAGARSDGAVSGASAPAVSAFDIAVAISQRDIATLLRARGVELTALLAAADEVLTFADLPLHLFDNADYECRAVTVCILGLNMVYMKDVRCLR